MKNFNCLSLIGYAAGLYITLNIIHNPVQAESLAEHQPLIVTQQNKNDHALIVVSGDNGQYTATIVLEASSAEVWAVLTDYNNFNQFIPNVISSQLIQSNGNVKILEQISERTFLGIPIQTMLRTENEEIYQEQINFKLISGDLSQLQGYWKIESVASANGIGNQVLLTYQVEAQPPSGIPPAIFYDIFKNSLEPTLNAIRAEAENK